MHAPHIPKFKEKPWPQEPWPLGAQYLASCLQQLCSNTNAFYAELASFHICVLGSHTFENYELTAGNAGE